MAASGQLGGIADDRSWPVAGIDAIRLSGR